MKRNTGFTLIELLIVVAIIGIVAAIAIPNLMVAYQKGRQKVTMAEMRTLGAAIESYATDTSFIPQVGSGTVEPLRPFLVSFFMEAFPNMDGWGSLLRWEYPEDLSDNYSIVSYGRDRYQGGPLGDPVVGIRYPVTRLSDFDNDIVFASGTFTFRPKI